MGWKIVSRDLEKGIFKDCAPFKIFSSKGDAEKYMKCLEYGIGPVYYGNPYIYGYSKETEYNIVQC